MKGLIRWNDSNKKFELISESLHVVARSKNIARLTWMIDTQQPVIRKSQITSYTIDVQASVSSSLVVNQASSNITPVDHFSTGEKFKFMGDLIDMVINKSALSMLITGNSGMGKTERVLSRLSHAGFISCESLLPTIDSLDDTSIVVEDSEAEIEKKVLAEMSRPQGDYTIVKGRVTAKACYRILYENKDRLIIFDDCDSVLKVSEAVSLIKAAIDTYQDRYVSWRTESLVESDLPQSFKFNGSIIFVSNLPMSEVDEAIRTRCFKVDVSLTSEQRIEYMKSMLQHVCPEVDYSLKVEALKVLEENQYLTDDINFRSLIKTIMIRAQDLPTWEKLAKFSLLEQGQN